MADELTAFEQHDGGRGRVPCLLVVGAAVATATGSVATAGSASFTCRSMNSFHGWNQYSPNATPSVTMTAALTMTVRRRLMHRR